MVTYNPYFRKERETVLIRVIIDRQIAKVINTGIKITEKQWDGERVVNHPNKKILNQKIERKISELQAVVTKAELLGVNLTKDRVKKLCEGDILTTDFYSHCEKWIQEKYANPGTRAAAMSDLRKINSFAPSLQFGDIDYRFLTRYERHLNEINLGNTPWKSIKFVRTMMYDAERIGGIVHNNPFKTGEYKMPRYIQPDKDGLTIPELDQLEKLLKEDHPTMVKIFTAKFLFMCYTGLRISDAKRMSAEHIKNGERLVITSKKTGITTNLKLHKRLANILAVLKSLPEKSISDQKLNVWLKTIQELAGVTRLKVTTHTGRHTFGCLLAEMGASEEEAKELMGVKNKNVIKVYYRLRQPQIDKAADRLNNL